MATRSTAYVHQDSDLTNGQAVTLDLYVLWPEGTPPGVVLTHLQEAYQALAHEVVARAS